jgi:hypothetical protein
MTRRLGLGAALGTLMWANAGWAVDCGGRVEEARGAIKQAEAAIARAKEGGKTAASGPLAKAKKLVLHAESDCKTGGGDVKKHAHAVREAREAQGFAEEAIVLAEKL